MMVGLSMVIVLLLFGLIVQAIQWFSQSINILSHDMDIDFCCFHISTSKKVLKQTNIPPHLHFE